MCAEQGQANTPTSIPDKGPQVPVMGLSAELRVLGPRAWGWDLVLVLTNSSKSDLLIPIHDYEQLKVVDRETASPASWRYPSILDGGPSDVIPLKSHREFAFPVARECCRASVPEPERRLPFLSGKGSQFSAWYPMRFAAGYGHPESLREFSYWFERAARLHATAWVGELRSNRVDLSV